MANQCKFCDMRIEKIKKLERKIARVRKLQHQYYRDTSTICCPKYVAENIAKALKARKNPKSDKPLQELAEDIIVYNKARSK